MGKHLGDYAPSAIIYDKFTTYRPSTSAKFTLAGSPAIAVYKDNSTTESTLGCSITADFDSRTGFNHWAVDTSASASFYASGSFFQVVLTSGTIDGVDVSGTVLASFTIYKASALRPTSPGETLNLTGGVVDNVTNVSTLSTISAGTRDLIAFSLLDLADGVETGMTLRQYLRLDSAVLLGKASGLGGTTATFRDVNDTTFRVVATVDADGNRTAVILDPT